MDEPISYDKIKNALVIQGYSASPVPPSQGVGNASNNSLLWKISFEFDADAKSSGIGTLISAIAGDEAKAKLVCGGFSIKRLSSSSPIITIGHFSLAQEAHSSVQTISDTIFNAKLSGVKRTFTYELCIDDDKFLVTESPIAPDLEKVKEQNGIERFNWEKTSNSERKAIGEYILGLSDARIIVKDLSKKHFPKVEAKKEGNDSFVITREGNGYLAHEEASAKAQEVVKTITGIGYYTAFVKACIVNCEIGKFNNGPKDRAEMINSGSALYGITQLGLIELKSECHDLTAARLSKNSHSK